MGREDQMRVSVEVWDVRMWVEGGGMGCKDEESLRLGRRCLLEFVEGW
jgi:hypothetical protein